MLPKKNRISKHLFKEAISKKRRVISNVFFTFVFGESSFKNSKISFIIPSSVSKKSTVRNKIKRRGKFIFLKNQNKFRGFYNIFVFFKKKSIDLTYKELKKYLVEAFEKSKIICFLFLLFSIL